MITLKNAKNTLSIIDDRLQTLEEVIKSLEGSDNPQTISVRGEKIKELEVLKEVKLSLLGNSVLLKIY